MCSQPSLNARASSRSSSILSAAIAVVTAAVAGRADAALPIFAGPASSPTQGGAFALTMDPPPSHSVGEGYVVGYSEVTSPGSNAVTATLAYRWNAFDGAIENLGNHSSNILSKAQVNVRGVNRAGGAAGAFVVSGSFLPGSASGSRAARWAAGSNTETQLIALPSQFGSTPPLRHNAEALAINNAGLVVGYSELYTGFTVSGTLSGDRAVRWDPDSTVAVNLGTASTKSSGFGSSRALAVTDAGLIGGVSQVYSATDADLGQRVVRWAPGSTTPTLLGTLGLDANSVTQCVLNGINQAGDIVGSAMVYSGGGKIANVPAPALWLSDAVDPVALGTLSGEKVRVVAGAANDINRGRVAVGYSSKRLASGTVVGDRAVRWNTREAYDPVELPVLSAGSNGISAARAVAINNLNVSVGRSNRYSGSTQLASAAVLWRDDGTIVDLNSYIAPNSQWQLTEARDISEAGFISGIGVFTTTESGTPHGYIRGFMMLVPEAGTYGRGDANFDTSINFADLVILAQHYNQPNASQSVSVGDFNLDGITNFADLVALAQNYNTGVASVAALGDATFAADWARAESLVPEPAMIVGLAAVGALRRRRVAHH